MSKTVIIGAGVIGLMSAWYLRQRGHDVLVLDMSRPGAGSSFGNCGWITPIFATPLPAPGLIMKSLGMLGDAEGPLRIKPRPSASLARWLLQFARKCRADAWRSGTAAYVELGQTTIQRYEELRKDGVEFEWHRKGMLCVGLDQEIIQRELDELITLQLLGDAQPTLLDGDAVRTLEPGLTPQVAGGFHVESQRHLRADTLIAGLVCALETRGVEIRRNTEVVDLRWKGASISGVVTRDGTVDASACLIAAGGWSGELARRWALRLPIQPGKGYSITIDKPETQLQHPLELLGVHSGCSPFNSALRIVGGMDLHGVDTTVDRDRVDIIIRNAEKFIGKLPTAHRTLWAGMRPLSPDGLPIIGRMPRISNLFAATGGGMLGITMAPVTGLAIAQLMSDEAVDVDIEPFRPDRF